MNNERQELLIINQDSIQANINQKNIDFPRITLPPLFLSWQSEARLAAFELMHQKNAEAVRMMPAHLPVMVTYGVGNFPANLTTRGIGLLPKEDKLTYYAELLENAARVNTYDPWEVSFHNRVMAIRSFYEHPDHFEESLLGGLEIFEGQSFKNLTRDPRASLLYTGQAPKFPSYQFNGLVEIIQEGNPYFRFLLAARELFARDSFHIHQIHYPYGYLFYPVEARDKTPFPRR